VLSFESEDKFWWDSMTAQARCYNKLNLCLVVRNALHTQTQKWIKKNAFSSHSSVSTMISTWIKQILSWSTDAVHGLIVKFIYAGTISFELFSQDFWVLSSTFCYLGCYLTCIQQVSLHFSFQSGPKTCIFQTKVEIQEHFKESD